MTLCEGKCVVPENCHIGPLRCMEHCSTLQLIALVPSQRSHQRLFQQQRAICPAPDGQQVLAADKMADLWLFFLYFANITYLRHKNHCSRDTSAEFGFVLMDGLYHLHKYNDCQTSLMLWRKLVES